mmetsp:Transcript_35625/g.59708  ORF Transcript_35625/g.59708 Transcript_35625/m.59708 type:complete len:284 (+) Transcript_35625:868-1719(+)
MISRTRGIARAMATGRCCGVSVIVIGRSRGVCSGVPFGIMDIVIGRTRAVRLSAVPVVSGAGFKHDWTRGVVRTMAVAAGVHGAVPFVTVGIVIRRTRMGAGAMAGMCVVPVMMVAVVMGRAWGWVGRARGWVAQRRCGRGGGGVSCMAPRRFHSRECRVGRSMRRSVDGHQETATRTPRLALQRQPALEWNLADGHTCFPEEVILQHVVIVHFEKDVVGPRRGELEGLLPPGAEVVLDGLGLGLLPGDLHKHVRVAHAFAPVSVLEARSLLYDDVKRAVHGP